MVKVEEWVEFAETSIEGTKKKKTEKQAYYNKKSYTDASFWIFRADWWNYNQRKVDNINIESRYSLLIKASGST